MELEQEWRTSILTHKQAGSRESESRPGWAFVSSKSSLSDTPPLARPHLRILPKQSSNWKSNIQVYGARLMRTTKCCMRKMKEEKPI